MTKNNQKGTVLFFTVLVLGTASAIALLALSRAGIDTFSDAEAQSRSLVVRENLFGCMDEVLIQFQVDPDFGETEIETVDAECDAVITTPLYGERDVVLTLTEGDVTRGVRVEFTLEPFAVTRVIESYN